MGCRFGVAFAEAGAQVWLYDVWQEHVNQMNANGLVVEDGVGGERTLEVNAVSDISRMPVSDVVVIFNCRCDQLCQRSFKTRPGGIKGERCHEDDGTG